MKKLPDIFQKNRTWATEIEKAKPGFFRKLSLQQSPKFLWIGCADSRVPANEICGLDPGEMFVHRNVANLVIQTDLNCLSVLQYAVDVLKVEHVIVCGHYGCGGVQAAIKNQRLGLIDQWLGQLKMTYQRYEGELRHLNMVDKVNRLCEINVVQQIRNLCHTVIVQDAWAREQSLCLHGWIYGLEDGQLKDLNVCVSGPREIP